MRTIRHECLDQFGVFGELHLRHVVNEFVADYLAKRAISPIDGQLMKSGTPENDNACGGRVVRRSRLGGLLNHYTGRRREHDDGFPDSTG